MNKGMEKTPSQIMNVNSFPIMFTQVLKAWGEYTIDCIQPANP